MTAVEITVTSCANFRNLHEERKGPKKETGEKRKFR